LPGNKTCIPGRGKEEGREEGEEGVGEGREKRGGKRRERGKQTTPTGERRHAADILHASHDPVLPYTLLHEMCFILPWC